MKRGSWWADGGGEVIRRIAPADEKRGEMRGEMRRGGRGDGEGGGGGSGGEGGRCGEKRETCLAFWVVEEGRKGVVGAARLVKGLGGRQVGSRGSRGRWWRKGSHGKGPPWLAI